MTNEQKGIWIEFEDERVFLKTAIIGGEMKDDSPMGMYSGALDVGDFGVALMHSNRAALKVMQDTFQLDIIQAQGFLMECIVEAIRRENEAKKTEKMNYATFKKIQEKSKDAL